MNKSEDQAKLEQVVEGFARIETDRKENRGNLGETNWWESTTMAVSAEHLRAMVEVAIGNALKTQKQIFDKQVEDLNKKLNECVVQTP